MFVDTKISCNLTSSTLVLMRYINSVVFNTTMKGFLLSTNKLHPNRQHVDYLHLQTTLEESTIA